MTDIEDIFRRHASIKEAIQAIIEKLIHKLETDGTITGYTFSSIVSEMATVSEPVRHACSALYENIQHIYCAKLVTEGFSNESASDIAWLMTASIEGAMMLCLTQKSTDPLKMIAKRLPLLLRA